MEEGEIEMEEQHSEAEIKISVSTLIFLSSGKNDTFSICHDVFFFLNATWHIDKWLITC